MTVPLMSKHTNGQRKALPYHQKRDSAPHLRTLITICGGTQYHQCPPFKKIGMAGKKRRKKKAEDIK